MLFSTQTHVLADKLGIDKALEIFAAAGYPALDYSLFNWKGFPFTEDYLDEAKRIRSKADSLGLKFIQAHAPFIWKTDVYKGEIIPLLPRAFEFCSILGIENIVVHPIQNGRFYGREEELFALNVEFYRLLAPYAKKCGVKIAIENMWQTHPVSRHITDDILADPADLVRMYDTLADSEAFTICLDLGHVALCGREPDAAIRTIGNERLGALHVHDVDYVSDLHTLPGVSKINWNNVCKALADINYRGSFNLEADSFFLGFPDIHYPAVAKFMADTCKVYVDMIEGFKKNA